MSTCIYIYISIYTYIRRERERGIEIEIKSDMAFFSLCDPTLCMLCMQSPTITCGAIPCPTSHAMPTLTPSLMASSCNVPPHIKCSYYPTSLRLHKLNAIRFQYPLRRLAACTVRAIYALGATIPHRCSGRRSCERTGCWCTNIRFARSFGPCLDFTIRLSLCLTCGLAFPLRHRLRIPLRLPLRRRRSPPPPP